MKNFIIPFLLSFLSLNAMSETSHEWVEPMRAIHAGFDGEVGYVAQLGDSMTFSMAFWHPISQSDPSIFLAGDDGLPLTPNNGKRWRDIILGTGDKGPNHGSFSGWTSDQALTAAAKILTTRKPETAIIMVGSNDILLGEARERYRLNLESIIDRCLAAHCIPILNTIPPLRGKDDAVAEANRIIRDIAHLKRIPLADYHAACIKHRPGKSWDGTLISEDGIHPTGGKVNDFSEENLRNSGYALRTWVNFLIYRELYFKVLEKKTASSKASQS